MMSQHFNAINIHAMAVTCVTVANVWLFVQNTRWLMYSNPVSSLIPTVDRYRAIDPVLEIPGIIIGAIVAYVLVFRYTFGIWRIRQSIFRHVLYTRVMSINSALLVIMTLLGVLQWKVWFNEFAYDVIVTALFGLIAVLVSSVMERRLMSSDQLMPSRTLPMYSLRSIASIWRHRR